MSDTDLPGDVYQLIEAALLSVDALELLIFLARNSEKQWMETEIADAMRPVAVTPSAVKEYLRLFQSCGLVSKKQFSRFQYEPSSPRLLATVDLLVKTYAERPVSLIQAIYTAAANKKIKAFADAFKIR